MDIKATQVHHVLVFSLVSRILLQITFIEMHITKAYSSIGFGIKEEHVKTKTYL